MENIKLPLALVAAMGVQLAGGVWWVSQQAATIASLEASVSEFASKMAVEDTVNTKRDVQDNTMEIVHLWDEADELWDEIDSMAMHITAINSLKQRIAAIETELRYIARDHGGMMDRKGGME